jgi:hypothetical protein
VATQTTRLLLRKPDPDPATGDFVNPGQDLNANFDKIDAAVGTFICTSGTRPTGVERWDGRLIYETDTRRNYMWSAGLATWLPLLIGRGADGPYLFGQSTDTSGEGANFRGSAVGVDILRSRVTSDANARFLLKAEGSMSWGPGTAAADTNLYRSAADTLRTDDSFVVGGTLTANSINVNTHLLGGWTTYTPSWTSITGGSPPSIGNGTLTARWRRCGPNMVHHEWYLVGGSTTNWGSAGIVYALSIGVGLTASATSLTHSNGPAWTVNNAVAEYPGMCRLTTTTAIRAWFPTTTNWSQSGPFAYGTDDKFSASLIFEVV